MLVRGENAGNVNGGKLVCISSLYLVFGLLRVAFNDNVLKFS